MENQNIFLSLLQVMFIGLKLSNIITWSWWIVFLPTLIPATLALLIVTVVLVVKRLR